MVRRKLSKLRAPRRRRKPRILICTPEITELPEGMGNAANYIRAKGGGLGDISAALISYLYQESRFELHVALPKYDRKIQGSTRISSLELDMLAPLLQRKGIHLIADSAFSTVTEVYDHTEAHPRIRRAEALQRHVVNHLLDDLRPDVVHCNDWMTGLIPAAARARRIKSLFTLHNVFTEKETPFNIDRSGIDVRRFANYLYYEAFPHDSEENWKSNNVDFTASGIFAADIINTVSPTFLDEIIDGEFQDIIPTSIRHAVVEKYEAGAARGILNAPADSIDPRLCKHIENYDESNVLEGKALNKAAFQRAMSLRLDPEAPLFFWPSRLYPQKGPELLLEIAEHCLEHHGAQIAIVANGSSDVEAACRKLARKSKRRFAMQPFDEDVSELGKAGADFILMPSRYEPCGLPQMESTRFGTLPVVRATGGLSDTVQEFDAAGATGNGFVFQRYEAQAFEAAVARAVAFQRLEAEVRRPILQRIMRESFEKHTLARTAQDYIHIYDELLGRRAGRLARES